MSWKICSWWNLADFPSWKRIGQRALGRFILDNYCRGASKSAGERAREHRRRIYTEEKAKVVAAVWGTEFIQFLAALAVLHQDDKKKRMKCTRIKWKKGWIHRILQIVLVSNSIDDLCLLFCINPSYIVCTVKVLSCWIVYSVHLTHFIKTK